MAQGKRAGARQKRTFRPALLLLALGVTGSVVAWGYLVYAAINFGASARGGSSQSWWFLALAAVGAVACLFLALVLLARISRAVGLTKAPAPRTDTHADTRPARDPDLPAGGRRASR